LSDFAFEESLRQRIQANLAAFTSRRVDPGDRLRHAAVGVVLLPDAQGETSFVLTRRLSTLRRHAGQWALPGGRLEPGESAQDAALREIREEINLSLQPTDVLGTLDDFVSRSEHLITPLVVWCREVSFEDVVISPDEVDSAYSVPLADLGRPNALHLDPLLHFELPSLPTTVHAPTAALIYQFREVALHAREVRVADTEQPFFAWR
jgi:8-oxo-dGTP pyrophosphatase MutT (NUDIX family)